MRVNNKYKEKDVESNDMPYQQKEEEYSFEKNMLESDMKKGEICNKAEEPISETELNGNSNQNVNHSNSNETSVNRTAFTS